MNKTSLAARSSSVVALTLFFAACGSSGSTSSAGTGGITGTGGTTGTGGGAGTAINCFDTPACKVDLYKAAGCQPAGTCVVQFPAAGGVAVCYANGVKFLTMLDLSTGQPTYSLVNSNGTNCFAAAVTVDNVSGEMRQVYGGGGNAGAMLKSDFIELHNRTAVAVNLAGWSVQYASSTGTTWQKTDLAGSLGPGQYLLVKEAQGSGGTTELPAPDVVGTIAMSATTGKVALVSIGTVLSGTCPAGPAIVDLVGYGSANCFEGTAVAALTNATAALREPGLSRHERQRLGHRDRNSESEKHHDAGGPLRRDQPGRPRELPDEPACLPR
jgi:hypothetical protein